MRVVHAAILLGWCLLIFWLSSRPVIPTPLWFDHQDKLFHAACYAVLGWLFWRWGCSAPAWSAAGLALASLMFCSLYGLSDEWHQSFVPGRNASTADWLADTIGAALMLAILCRRAWRPSGSTSNLG